jgi:hypothetical protein
MMTLSNINNSTANRLIKTFNQDKGAAKIIDEIKGNENIDLDFVEDTQKDDKLTTLDLDQKNGTIKVVVNVDDIKRKAKETGVKEDVFLSQQIASVMSASYLMLDAIKDGKDPSQYLTNGEFLVASNLLADGMVRRTNKDAIPYLDQERASMAERIKAEHGTIETDSSDAFERADALGFKGINTGGWADKIVQGFGDLPDLDELDKTTKTEKDDEVTDDEVAEADDTDDTTEVANNDDDDTTVAKADDDDDEKKKEKEGFNWGNLLLGGLGGFFLAKVMSPDKSADVKKQAEQNTQIALQQQQQQFQQILSQQQLQQQAQQKAVLAQQQAYQVKLAEYQAKVAAANTASSTPTPYSYPSTYTASTPVVYSTTSSTTPTYVIPAAPAKSDWT